MSFDSTFLFSAAFPEITNNISRLQTRLDEVNAKIACLGGIVGYASIVPTETTIWTDQKTYFENQITSLNEILTALHFNTGLSAGDKTKLYDFYLLCDISPSQYTLKLLCNAAAMIVDSDISDIVADTTNDMDAKQMIAHCIINRYPINLLISLVFQTQGAFL